MTALELARALLALPNPYAEVRTVDDYPVGLCIEADYMEVVYITDEEDDD